MRNIFFGKDILKLIVWYAFSTKAQRLMPIKYVPTLCMPTVIALNFKQKSKRFITLGLMNEEKILPSPSISSLLATTKENKKIVSFWQELV